jgi:hypothetical protein
MSDWTGSVQNWKQHQQNVTDALIAAVSEIIAIKKLSTDDALKLLMSNMPIDWFVPYSEKGYWGYGNMWVGITPGLTTGSPGDGEGDVSWKVGGDQSAYDDMSHSFYHLYDTYRMQPLLAAKQAALSGTGSEVVGHRNNDQSGSSSFWTFMSVLAGLAAVGGIIATVRWQSKIEGKRR